jgi:vacuolar-type H+-ATPase subunit D/Vma8
MTRPHASPGRAGRLQQRRRLQAALRGAELLEQKLRILRTEHQRLLQAESAAAEAWRERLRVAETWLLRGLLLGGEQALRAACDLPPAEATATWTASMGVAYPSGTRVTVPARPPEAAAPGNTALIHAEAAYGDAVRAAGEYAAALAAARRVAAEVIGTRQRVRALRRHWIPHLQDTLARIDLALEQAEHEDWVRRRWAATEAEPIGTVQSATTERTD